MNDSYGILVKRATLIATLLSLILVIIKMIAWWYTGAMSLLASLLDSGVDLSASGLNFILARYALMPADNNHAFGHGKAEPLAALGQSTFIMGSAAFLLLNGVKHFLKPEAIELPVLGLVVTSISTLFVILLILYQKHVIRKTNSQVVKADMLHYKSDVILNIGVILALFLSWFGFIYADAIFTVLIGIYILYGAFNIGREAINSLLDKALSNEENELIKKISYSFPEVQGVHDLKTRCSGKMKFIQLHIELDDNMRLFDAHKIAQNIELALIAEFPYSEVIIHQDPKSLGEHEHHNNK